MPEAVLSNTDLEKLVDTNDEWIATRTGIRCVSVVNYILQGTKPVRSCMRIMQGAERFVPDCESSGFFAPLHSMHAMSRRRHVLASGESLSQHAALAAQRALDMAGVAAADVDLIILCTSSPDDLFGSACQVHWGASPI